MMGVSGVWRGLGAGLGPESYHPRDLGPQGCRGGNAENERTIFAPPLGETHRQYCRQQHEGQLRRAATIARRRRRCWTFGGGWSRE